MGLLFGPGFESPHLHDSMEPLVDLPGKNLMGKMKIQFTKMTGAGNDFIVIDDRENKLKSLSRLAPKLCDRRWGIGADGLILLRNHPRAYYEMKYYNADGSYGGMCGNGGRCIAYYAILHKIAPPKHDFVSVNHIYKAESLGNNKIALLMKDPTRIKLKQKLMISELNLNITYNFIDTGAPHVVIDINEFPRFTFENIELEKIGRLIRFHKEFKPEGTNVNIIERKGSRIHIRTYERGVEAETLACGTGSIAAGIIAHLLWEISSPAILIPKSKKTLQVSFTSNKGKISRVRLIGPAEVVFTGSIEI